jgi:hypothetical protein
MCTENLGDGLIAVFELTNHPDIDSVETIEAGLTAYDALIAGQPRRDVPCECRRANRRSDLGNFAY